MAPRRTRLFLAIALVVLGIAACTDEPGAGGGPLTGTGLIGTTWRLAAVNGQAPPIGPDVTLQFEPERVSGDAPCNSFSGRFTQDPRRGSLELGPLVSTKRACVDDARGALETIWLRALNGVLTARLEGDARLDLTAADGTELVLQRVR